MSYLLLIMEQPGKRGRWSEAEARAAYEQMAGFNQNLKARGLCLASESLTLDAVRIEVRSGRQIVADGPFAEAKEIVGGFFLLDVPTREHAVAIARECPAAAWATVEVREIGPCTAGTRAAG